jgi:DNA-directed RNA polymerase specialized sigma24 family protein
LSVEDQHIILQLKENKVSALEAHYKKYAYQLYKVCRGFYLSHEDAEEIVQDIFIKIWCHRDELKSGFSFRYKPHLRKYWKSWGYGTEQTLL